MSDICQNFLKYQLIWINSTNISKTCLHKLIIQENHFIRKKPFCTKKKKQKTTRPHCHKNCHVNHKFWRYVMQLCCSQKNLESNPTRCAAEHISLHMLYKLKIFGNMCDPKKHTSVRGFSRCHRKWHVTVSDE